ncbi:MAG: hypothetical protein LBJ15_08700 [Comamonas sp.]|jgi:hypothetical protein|uniref:hypothetical protein n=1 Tax=Comamonas sp. TaxID=34028 RepID=UPI00281E4000|nr:hypothetical protein [Comamonas sp.]MDR0214064.1 hypothetical protein [Comamonas sp.]
MLANALTQLGPCLSTRLAEHLVEVGRLSPAAARQRVARSPAGVKKLAHLPFARGVRFMYFEKDYASPLYWDRLFEAILASQSAYARALVAVRARGAVPVAHFPAACGAPVAQKKHISAETVLARMISAGVFKRMDLPGIGECIMARDSADSIGSMPAALSRFRARLITERILLDSVKEWLRRLGIASFNLVKLRDSSSELPMVGTFAWDLTAPSYLGPLVSRAKTGAKKHGLIACDVLLEGSLGLANAETFLYKVSSLQALKRLGNALFIFVSEHYAKEAFDRLRGEGILAATPETLFGKDVAEGFKELEKVLDLAARQSVDPAKFNMLFDRLGKVEGAVGNMRGALFELLVAEVARREHPANPILNKICTGRDGAKAEIDVWVAIENRQTYLIECKGHAPGSAIDDAEIDRWLDKRIPAARGEIERTMSRPPTRLSFELWYTGVLSESSLHRINRTRDANQSKFDIVLVDPVAIRARVATLNDLSLLKTFEQHFLPPQATPPVPQARIPATPVLPLVGQKRDTPALGLPAP